MVAKVIVYKSTSTQNSYEKYKKFMNFKPDLEQTHDSGMLQLGLIFKSKVKAASDEWRPKSM